MFFLRFTDNDSCPKEARVLVVDLLIGDVAFEKAFAIVAKDVSDILIDNVVCKLFAFSKNDQVILLVVLSSFFLVRWCLWHG